jgi:hypothetical protein
MNLLAASPKAGASEMQQRSLAMNRRLTLVALAALAVSPLAMAAEAAATTPRLTAEQIVEKNAAARGGLAAWRAVQSISYGGEMEAGGKDNHKLPFTMTLQRPHKSRLEIRFQEKTAVQVYDGKQGWKLRPFLNRDDVEPYNAAEIKSAAALDELDGALIDHARKGVKVELAGTEAVEGKTAYKLKLTPKSGAQRNVWVDAKSFLELKMDGEPRKLDGRMHKVAVYLRDYKRESGLMVAHELETAVEGVKPKSSHKMFIQTVKLNPVIEAATFARPTPGGAKLASN